MNFNGGVSMKAYVYHGPDQKGAWEEVPNPTILEPTDVIAREGAPTSR